MTMTKGPWSIPLGPGQCIGGNRESTWNKQDVVFGPLERCSTGHSPMLTQPQMHSGVGFLG